MKTILLIISLTSIIIASDIRQMITIDSKNLLTLAESHIEKQEYDKALETYQKALTYTKDKGSIYVLIGDLYIFEKKKYKKGAEYYKLAIEYYKPLSEKGDVSADIELAKIYQYRLKDYDNAVKHIQRYIDSL